jgi:hypothetical protein
LLDQEEKKKKENPNSTVRRTRIKLRECVHTQNKKERKMDEIKTNKKKCRLIIFEREKKISRNLY